MHVDAKKKRAAFRELHKAGCFVLPNPWDIGSAKRLEKLGFKALATTSSGFAWSMGRDDGEMSRDEVLSHMRTISEASDLPVNADFEAGFADSPEGGGVECGDCDRNWGGRTFYRRSRWTRAL